jgi:hypothetical protein
LPEVVGQIRSRKRRLTINAEPTVEDTGLRFEPRPTESGTLSGILKRKQNEDMKFRMREIMNYFYNHPDELCETAESLSKLANEN